jgi:hypothetical protein
MTPPSAAICWLTAVAVLASSQKPGDSRRTSSSLSCAVWPGMSKIPPHLHELLGELVQLLLDFVSLHVQQL